ncbi:MAG: BlaI/MecI/CopY family transcriptional regulator [Clostridia bacterium]|nr:BlaI/MecI/CopY family transcriptional regulator [Clostridia bacterium]
MDRRLGALESKFADIIWENEPLSSSRLVGLAGEKLGWKKSTVYTVLRRLCEKGLFQNENGTVTSLVSGETFRAAQCRQFLDDSFEGSLPAFLAAFMNEGRLSEKEAEEIEAMIRRFRQGG